MGASAVTQREEAAYVLLEVARLQCEYRSAAHDPTVRAEVLPELRRELGLGGFYASANIPPARRREALARAHHLSAAHFPAHQHKGVVLVALLEWARDAVEAALIPTEASDHTHLAHVHVLRALEILPRVVVCAPSASVAPQ